MEPGADRIWRFGSIELDERSLELRVRGEPAALEPKPLQVLFHLLRHAGEVVTKEELAEACWPRRILSESVLTKTVSRLREVLQDGDQALIRTVHGYGYRLVAAVSVSSPGRQAAQPSLAFRPGDRLQLRPGWLLAEQLGSGRSGEAWLARHERTGERRVYKFPLDVLALGSLKREITLSRLLAEPASGRVARVLDWNLEQEPYFIEYEHADGGNLMQWAEASGGLASLPLATRLDLAVQIAETLAIAHSVGVLHKDLKPANVLVDTADGGRPRLRLSDFGSGGVLDPERLDALGITRLGFTRTLALADASSGTPLYLAPEVLAGQPATVQGDIYALGVMLYQLAIGDFRRPLAPGWELEIGDEMLRADIADAAAGDPRRRLADAGQLAQRLRQLDLRRQEHERQRHEQARIESERRALERLQLRRRWVLATMAALVAGTLLSLGLFLEARRARAEATHAAQASQAVAGFLGTDIFSAISRMTRPAREWTVLELLNSAAPEIDRRFSARPEVAAPLHLAVGEAYLQLEQLSSSEAHLQRAFSLAGAVPGEPALQLRLQAASELVVADYLAGRLEAALARYEPLLQEGEARLGSAEPRVQSLRNSLCWAYTVLGDWTRALALRHQQISIFAADAQADAAEHANAERHLGSLLIDLGEFEQASAVLASAEKRLAGAPGVSEFASLPLRMAIVHLLIQRGDHHAAEQRLAQVDALAQRWAPSDDSQYLVVLTSLRAQLLVEQGRHAEALPLLHRVAAATAPAPGEKIDQRWLVQELLGRAYQQTGRAAEAEAQLRLALRNSLEANGRDHPYTLRLEAALADSLRHRGKLDEAAAVLDAATARGLRRLPADHPIQAERQRVRALLLAAQGQATAAQPVLAAAQRIYEQRLGAAHWRSRRAADELRALQAPPPVPRSIQN